ncbi:MAG: glycosyltransferase family 2 protein [Bacteroidota bacterium]
MVPKISVVVPVYNREKLLIRALDSVKNQTFKDFECIIIDNNSSDNTFNVAKKYTESDKRFSAYKQERNVGPVRNWLRGVELSNAEWIKILFSDDYLVPECLEKCFRVIGEFPEIGFVYFNSNTNLVKIETNITGIYQGYTFLWKSLATHSNVPVSPTSAMFRRHEIIEALSKEIKQYNNFNYFETGAGPDQSIYLYSADKYKHIYFIDEILALYGDNQDSITIRYNKSLPGFLLLGVLFAQLTFLKNSLIKKKLKGKLFYLTISFHILKWFVRFKILNKIKLHD